MVRGLLCRHCNIGFGHFFEDPAFLRRAADYGEFFIAHQKEILRGILRCCERRRG
jgi:Recombination endonuclease VII